MFNIIRIPLILIVGIILFIILSGLWDIAIGRSSIYRSGGTNIAKMKKNYEFGKAPSIWLQPPLVNLLNLIGNYLPIDEEKELKETEQLSRANLPFTARQYRARSFIIIPIGILLSFAFYLAGVTILAPIGLALTIALYFKASQELKDIIQEKNEGISQCLPPFILSVIAGLHNSSDIISVVERYIPFAGEAIRKDLEIFVLNMKTGEINSSLVAFKNRLDQDEITRLVNILININRGIPQDEPLKLLSGDMDSLAQDNLIKRYASRPQKLRRVIIPSGIIAVASLIYVLVSSLPSTVNLF